jgi:hypothetical protein
MTLRFAHLLSGALLISTTLFAQAPSPDERLATLKKSLAESAMRIRQYQWVETTTISLKGEEKSSSQKTVHYGADGKLQKTPIAGPAAAEPAPSKGGRGGRGGRVKEKIVENKKDDIKEYMEKAVALIQSYVPPNPAKIQAAKDAGKMAVQPSSAGGARIEFKDYVKPKDLLAIEVDPSGTRLSNITVASYMDSPDDAVTLNVVFAALEDGTSYTSKTTLDAKAKNITVVVSNSGYKKMAQ